MMNIKYRQLKAFALAGQFGSFVQAADALAITQPSFSVLIRELEHDLGMQLFERTTRSCHLTAAGISFYEEVHTVLQDLESVYQHARDISAGRRGKLAIAAVASLAFGILTEAVGVFHRQYPEVRILMKEALNAGVISAVKQGDVELGVAGVLSGDSGLEFMPLFSDRLMVVTPLHHPAIQGKISWETIGKHPLILLGSGSAERALQISKVAVKPAFEVAHMATAIAMVRNGMGITILPGSALTGLNVEGLHYEAMPGELARRELGVLYRSRKSLGPAALAFIEVLKATVPSDPAILRIAATAAAERPTAQA
ncbi:MAG: LysR family transcriptional regulator [Polaromonas sp.]|nr:LysR family transcriptional regulator [Polaromonas sp.]